jgi:hypothetical protein
MNRFAAVSSVTNAVLTLVLQGSALFLLTPAGYGEFSARFLIFALLLSVSYSVITDVWARSGHEEPWATYGGALFWFSAIVAVLAVTALLLLQTGVAGSLLFGGAVALAVYRHGARYFAGYSDRWREVVVADAVGMAVFCGALALGAPRMDTFLAISLAWSLSTLFAIVVSGLGGIVVPGVLVRWVRRHRRQIAGLWVDTALLDLGNIGTPFVLFPLMTPAAFGTYRGVSSAAVPARLVLAPLRAQLGRHPLSWFRAGSTFLGAGGLGVGLGLLVGLAVWIIGGSPLFASSILPRLVPFAAAAGLFTAASTVSYFYYIGARTHLTLKGLRAGRIFESIVMTAGPLLGFLLAGLPGAVWGYVIGSVLNTGRWVALMRVAAAKDGEPDA